MDDEGRKLERLKRFGPTESRSPPKRQSTTQEREASAQLPIYDFSHPRSSAERKVHLDPKLAQLPRFRLGDDETSSVFLTVHPALELARAQALRQLRQYYNRECCSLLSARFPPRESFNRWLMERLWNQPVSAPYREYLLPLAREPLIGPSLKHEIFTAIPALPRKPRSADDARSNLFQWLKAARQMLPRNGSRAETTAASLDASSRWLDRAGRRATQDELVARLKALQEESGEFFRQLLEPNVDALCLRLMKDSDHLAKEMQQKQSAPTAIPSTAVTMQTKHGGRSFSFQSTTFDMKEEHYQKLASLWRLLDVNTGLPDESLTVSIWCLLQRYHAFFGLDRNEGFGLQAALPEAAFHALSSLFEVDFECFASPFNCYYPNYCSAFFDTDWRFGSLGSFLDFRPRSGSFEANPPFTEEIMEAMVRHMHALLGESGEPLSFAIFIPEWVDPPTTAIALLLGDYMAKFLRSNVVIPPDTHRYVSGSQHRPEESQRHFTAVHGTHLFFVQNDAGFAKWPPTPEKIDTICKAMRG